ncbi:sugar phosphate isomerase/epimerase [Candidatus Poribacteria bacterium]|nr:sugar phosphate isomerase/epimerase [Candidatus Poribacteria bacterium]
MKLASQEGLVSGKELSQKLDNLAEYGYQGIEFWGGGLEKRQDEIIRATENHPVKPSTICAGYSGCLLDGARSERDKAVEGIRTLLKVAANIGAVGLIMVPIFGAPRINDLSPYKTARQLEVELLVELLKDLGQYASEVGSLILVEPLNRYETHFIKTLNDGVDICKQVNSSNVAIMADFFHTSIEERNIAESIEAAGSYIKHVHLADSTRQLPGYGHTDFKSGFEALRKVGYQNYMALECGVPGPSEVELPKSAQYMKRWL